MVQTTSTGGNSLTAAAQLHARQEDGSGGNVALSHALAMAMDVPASAIPTPVGLNQVSGVDPVEAAAWKALPAALRGGDAADPSATKK